jgi:hypothetical protein
MLSPDATYPLAFVDVYQLFEIIDKEWHLFEPSLIGQREWHGRVDELRKIRHRMAHCRRPPGDDLNRLDQTLRDLEKGAYRALTSFTNKWRTYPGLDEPLVAAWIDGGHDRYGIVEHAAASYQTRFSIWGSQRPWARPRPDGDKISGTPGHLWHAMWSGGNGPLRLREWWEDSYLDVNDWRELIVYVCTDGPGDLSVSFAAVDDPTAIANAIEYCFEAILHHQEHGWPGTLEESEAWCRRYDDLDPRVQVGTQWVTTEEWRGPISIFGA